MMSYYWPGTPGCTVGSAQERSPLYALLSSVWVYPPARASVLQWLILLPLVKEGLEWERGTWAKAQRLFLLWQSCLVFAHGHIQQWCRLTTDWILLFPQLIPEFVPHRRSDPSPAMPSIPLSQLSVIARKGSGKCSLGHPNCTHADLQGPLPFLKC